MNIVALFNQQDAFISIAPGNVSDYPLQLSDSGQPLVVEVPATPDYDPQTKDIRLTRNGWEIIPRVFPVPSSVPMWSLRAILDIAGLTPLIDAVLAQYDEPERTIILRAWEYGNYIRRDSPTIAGLAVALNKTQADIDVYFIAASNLNP